MTQLACAACAFALGRITLDPIDVNYDKDYIRSFWFATGLIYVAMLGLVMDYDDQRQ